MATIKAIEARSVHQIQSGQVIVDLCSVVKELVENSLDAGATTVEVRFKNYGLDAIEVQDNGTGISPPNYETVALKHYTSKISNYEDLSTLQTFGFRGEALSSLCALSKFHITTAQASEVPKGKRLEFDVSGKLKSTTIVASQKGTAASVEGLFEQLPVRRKELTKNIKREYGKALGLLHAYACISTRVKFTVKNTMPKGKNAMVFATNSNATTKENIANVYGAKTLPALVPLDLDFEVQPSATHRRAGDVMLSKISIRGHISRPVYGEGRQTPDRQMFFVNARPCGLPQVAKAINEVYKSFNVSQSPFIFADFIMDTNAYDVNVSPDKRTILLHDSVKLVEKLRTCLTELFEQQEQTMPQSQLQNSKLPSFKQLPVRHGASPDSSPSARADQKQVLHRQRPSQNSESDADLDEAEDEDDVASRRPIHDFSRNQTSTREDVTASGAKLMRDKAVRARQKMVGGIAENLRAAEELDENDIVREVAGLTPSSDQDVEETLENAHERYWDDRVEQEQRKLKASKAFRAISEEVSIPVVSPIKPSDQSNFVQNAFDRIRPKRPLTETATITVGDKTVTTIIGSQRPNKVQIMEGDSASNRKKRLKTTSKLFAPGPHFSQSLRHFAAPGTEVTNGDLSEDHSVSECDAEGDIKSDHSNEDSDFRTHHDVQPDEKEFNLGGHVVEPDTGSEVTDDGRTDGDYVDEAEKRTKEDARVADLIRAAEDGATRPSKDSIKRANKVVKGGFSKDSTTALLARIDGSIGNVDRHIKWMQRGCQSMRGSAMAKKDDGVLDGSEEDRLSLTVSKDDFARMHIVGQFNLGFILAVRPPSSSLGDSEYASKSDELFIIDQHASDEKFNFERLQADTIVNNQRLVRAMLLELTAVEEEIVIENSLALEKNGFVLDIDTSGNQPIGRRCKLLSLPLSKEVVFDSGDLDELIHLLAESPPVGPDSVVPRPSKVRKMFAMRACRSSIMIGKTLTSKQMSTVVRHMGMIDKPWNCPHGRPTMRHLVSLNALDVWDENDGSGGLVGQDKTEAEIWRSYQP